MALIDKVTDGIGVRLTDDQKRELEGLAAARGMKPSALARLLIEQYLQSEREKYHALHEIFGDGREITKDNMVSRG